MAGELQKTNATFGKLEDAVLELTCNKAEAVQLEKLRADVAKMVHGANTATAEMQRTVGEAGAVELELGNGGEGLETVAFGTFSRL